QQAVLRSLQAQINSHFLYNALESINSMAYLARHHQIERTALALAEMLRYTSEYTQTVVGMMEEVHHAVHYVEIMQIRYPSEIDFEYEVDDESRQAVCPKAIIQPIIENSIKHGLEKTGKHLILRLSVRKQGS